MRFRTRHLAALALLAGACSDSSGGAVGVRWRVVEAPTGLISTDCMVADPAENINVKVQQVRLIVVSVLDGTTQPSCPSCTQLCTPLEATTAFEIPEGRYLFSLEALTTCGLTIGDSPPPIERDILRGQITNLDLIGISIPPCSVTAASCDLGLTTTSSCLDASVVNAGG